MRQADLNFEKLKTESERLEQHTKKSVNWLLWLMLILVSFTFISMILFIRIFPRLRWWRWSLADLELLARHTPALEGTYCTGLVAPHTTSIQAVVVTKQTQKKRDVIWAETFALLKASVCNVVRNFRIFLFPDSRISSEEPLVGRAGRQQKS